jgi:FAD/FMN-containing dehydrogenase
MKNLAAKLKEIVGSDYVSDHPEEKFIYSSDMGTMPPSFPDFVVMPDTTEEIQKIVRLANKEGVGITPMGGGLTLSGLVRPLKGGIVLDLKRMNRIIEVNEKSRYAVVEAGTSQGMLQAYLKSHHPTLKHSIPDAPPIATIGGNVLIHGSGHISQTAGFHSEALNSLEAVLPTGEIVRIGSCSTSPYWFSRAPLPDLAGLFIGWAGTTGIVTKLSIKLYPSRPYNDISIFVTENPEYTVDVIHQVTGTQVAEDVLVSLNYEMPGFQIVTINYSADAKEELTWKRNMIRRSLQKFIDDNTGGFMFVFSIMKAEFMEAPMKSMTRAADEKKGGGFEYVGAIIPIHLFPEACKVGIEIAENFNVPYNLGARIVGQGHCMMFAFAYTFNRADEKDMDLVRASLETTNEKVLEMGGIPWKAEAPAQKQIIKQMDPNTFALMNRIRTAIDPNGIMNPGNWEVQ